MLASSTPPPSYLQVQLALAHCPRHHHARLGGVGVRAAVKAAGPSALLLLQRPQYHVATLQWGRLVIGDQRAVIVEGDGLTRTQGGLGRAEGGQV